MVDKKMKYEDVIAEGKKKWEEKSPEEKAALVRFYRRGVERFVLMWDIVKRIEKELNTNVMGIVRDEIWKHSFEAGERLAKKYEEHGLKELYDAFFSQAQGLVDAEWFEFNEKVLHKWNRECPNIQHLRDLGKTDEEIKEIAPYYCLQDIGIIAGFNPILEVFPQSRSLLAGEPHCTYRVEDNGGK